MNSPNVTTAKQRLLQRLTNLPWYGAAFLALCAGGMQSFALAPFHYWPAAILGLGLFSLLLLSSSRRYTAIVSICFGLGLFSVGVSWVYVSIHQFGGASVWFAIFLTFLFVSFLAVVFALPFIFFSRLSSSAFVFLLLIFPASYIFGEWLRSWLLTGFPWLYVGYGHNQSVLAGWAPIIGVLGVGYLVCLTSALLACWVAVGRVNYKLIVATFTVVCIWFVGAQLRDKPWTNIDTKQPIRVAMVQPNIPQEVKWHPDFIEPTLEKLETMSEPLWQYDWIIWPEAAVPIPYHRALDFLNKMNEKAYETHTGLLTGIIYDDKVSHHFYNSIAGFGDAMGIYHKRRLVPFGEYVPLENWLRGAIEFFNLPTSYINLGPKEQGGMSVGGINIAPAVCYEIAYSALIARHAKLSNVLLTVSNEAWFVDSIEPFQLMQMAQMRALETGRYLIRSTNTGISGIVDAKGNIVVQSRQYISDTLVGTVYPAYGMTPFMRWGNIPIILLMCCVLFGRLLCKKLGVSALRV